MKIRYLAILAALAVLGFSIPAAAHDCSRHNPGHKHCDDEGPQTTYTVELTGRVFNFGPPGVDITPNAKEGALIPDAGGTLTFSRPGGVAICDPDSTDDTEEAACAWDAVFAACENFFGPEPIPGIGPPAMLVEGFTVPADEWTVQKAGGVRLGMSILFDSNGNSLPPGGQDPHFSVNLQLIGITFFNNPSTPWLPAPGSSEIYPIEEFWITGGTVKGVRPKKGCVSGGSAEQVDFDQGQARTLVITAAPAAE